MFTFSLVVSVPHCSGVIFEWIHSPTKYLWLPTLALCHPFIYSDLSVCLHSRSVIINMIRNRNAFKKGEMEYDTPRMILLIWHIRNIERCLWVSHMCPFLVLGLLKFSLPLFFSIRFLFFFFNSFSSFFFRSVSIFLYFLLCIFSVFLSSFLLIPILSFHISSYRQIPKKTKQKRSRESLL